MKNTLFASAVLAAIALHSPAPFYGPPFCPSSPFIRMPQMVQIDLFYIVRVPVWRFRLRSPCLGSCADCMVLLVRPKISSETGFLGLFVPPPFTFFPPPPPPNQMCSLLLLSGAARSVTLHPPLVRWCEPQVSMQPWFSATLSGYTTSATSSFLHFTTFYSALFIFLPSFWIFMNTLAP